jgi:hypothetical protein
MRALRSPRERQRRESRTRDTPLQPLGDAGKDGTLHREELTMRPWKLRGLGRLQRQVYDVFAPSCTTVQPLWWQVRTTRPQLTDVLVSPNPLDTSVLHTYPKVGETGGHGRAHHAA